jgi:hypothetical protein
MKKKSEMTQANREKEVKKKRSYVARHDHAFFIILYTFELEEVTTG